MSDSKTNETAPQQTTWQAIVLDLIILILIMGGIGSVLKVAMDACAVKSPIEDLTATIRKGDVDDKTNKDTVFLTELEDGLKEHADFINQRDDTDRTPLMWVCYANSIDPKEVAKIDLNRLYYVRELLKVPGIKAAAVDEDGFSALHWAAWSGLEGVSLELIAHGLDLNAAEKNGYTPLMLAAMRGQASTVKMLLSLGADASVKNKDGETALDLALSHQKAYAANESGLYEMVTGRKGALFYIPIYEEGRSKGHSESVKLLQTPPAAATVEELLKELATREAKARAERLKEAKDKEGEKTPEPLPAETAPEEQVPAAGVAEEPQTA